MSLGPRDRRYCRTTRARQTGRLIMVAHAADWSDDPAAVGWVAVCLDHDITAGYPTLEVARVAAAHPTEWCPTCRAGVTS
jgi:hypothetical protein